MRKRLVRPDRPWTRFARLLLPALLLALVAGCTNGDQTTFEPKSDFTNAVQDIYVLVIWMAAVVFVVVLGATLVISIWFRERPGRVAKQIHGNTRLEVIWTIIPVVIVAVIAVPTWGVILDHDKDPPPDALEVHVIGHQWWFEFYYPEYDLRTGNELHVPDDRAVSLTLTSADVIHSFWVPQLVGKRDLVPGHTNKIWFTPEPDAARAEPYLGQCAEFCGLSHANMRFMVFVDTPEDFDAWVENETSDAAAPQGDLAQQGLEIIQNNPVFTGPDGETVLGCASCHTIQGAGAAGAVGPNLTHVGSRTRLAARVLENTPEDLARWIRDPSKVKPGVEPDHGSMPAFGDVLTDEQLAAIVAYLQSLQ